MTANKSGRPRVSTRLTDAQRDDIRARYVPTGPGRPRNEDEPRVTLKQLAEEYGITIAAVRYIALVQKPRSITTYEGIHLHLKRLHGPARLYVCSGCGNQAAEWSYDGADPNATHTPQQGLWSPDPAHYTPMCVKCHRELDRKRRS